MILGNLQFGGVYRSKSNDVTKKVTDLGSTVQASDGSSQALICTALPSVFMYMFISFKEAKKKQSSPEF